MHRLKAFGMTDMGMARGSGKLTGLKGAMPLKIFSIYPMTIDSGIPRLPL